MFVVKRPFRNKGKVYTAGSVITEPADIKRFKGKLAEGKIIVVTEQTHDKMRMYFKQKFGVDIGEYYSESDEAPVDEAPVDEAPVDEALVDEAPVAKVVAKAVAIK